MAERNWEFRILTYPISGRLLCARLPGKSYVPIANRNVKTLIEDRDACIKLAEKMLRDRPDYLRR